MNRALVALALVACGHKADAPADPVVVAPTKPGVEILSSSSGDGAAAVAVAQAYVKAVGARDWAAACATRAKAEQDRMASIGGTCADGMAIAFEKQPVELIANATIARPRRRDGIIVVDMVMSFHDAKPEPMFLAQEDHKWVVIEREDSTAF